MVGGLGEGSGTRAAEDCCWMKGGVWRRREDTRPRHIHTHIYTIMPTRQGTGHRTCEGTGDERLAAYIHVSEMSEVSEHLGALKRLEIWFLVRYVTIDWWFLEGILRMGDFDRWGF